MDDLTRRDSLGRTPFHIAIERAGKFEEEDVDVVIQQLLDDGGPPQFASIPTDDKGTLPLLYALKVGLGFGYGVCHISKAFPGAVAIPDPETKLISCLLAAVSDRSTVATIFCLMREMPNLIADLCISTIS